VASSSVSVFGPAPPAAQAAPVMLSASAALPVAGPERAQSGFAPPPGWVSAKAAGGQGPHRAAHPRGQRQRSAPSLPRAALTTPADGRSAPRLVVGGGGALQPWAPAAVAATHTARASVGVGQRVGHRGAADTDSAGRLPPPPPLCGIGWLGRARHTACRLEPGISPTTSVDQANHIAKPRSVGRGSRAIDGRASTQATAGQHGWMVPPGFQAPLAGPSASPACTSPALQQPPGDPAASAPIRPSPTKPPVGRDRFVIHRYGRSAQLLRFWRCWKPSPSAKQLLRLEGGTDGITSRLPPGGARCAAAITP